MRDFTWITWLNYLSGYEYWMFFGYADELLEVSETGETKTNIFPNWPKSYSSGASEITKQSFRRTKKQKIVRSQNLTARQARFIAEAIRSSVVVEAIETRADKRRMIVDNQSATVVKGSDKMHFVNLTLTYTDEYPSQHI